MCIFCKIANGEMNSNKVLEDDKFIAFHDINPKAPIHILVIPKVHVEKFDDTSPTLMAEMTPFIKKVAVTLGLDKSGYRLITNNGEDAGQEVKHLHFHLLGGAKLTWPHVEDTDSKKFI